MTFHSLYAHGFARVAACTADVVHRRPGPQRREHRATSPAAAPTSGVAVAVFPELALTGYSIDDLLGQDAAARRGARRPRHARRGLHRAAPGAHRRRSAAPSGPAVQHRRRDPPRARCSASSPSCTCPTTASSTSAGSSPPGAGSPAWRSRSPVDRAPFGTDLLFDATDVDGPDRRGGDLRGHVRAGAAVQRAGAGRGDGAGQPVRQPDHHRPRRHPQPAVPAASRCAAWRPTCTRRPGRASRPPT